MTPDEILNPKIANGSLILGFYGGGNFGDELLLEVILNKLHESGANGITIGYSEKSKYDQMHRDFGYSVVETQNRRHLIAALLRPRAIILGGGGFWGRDVNANTFVMSIGFFILGRLLRKKIYLLGVGFYNSTNFVGRLSGCLAAWGSDAIIARDNESYKNFRRFTRRVHPGRDVAFLIDPKLIDSYKSEINQIDNRINIQPGKHRSILVAYRSFHGQDWERYRSTVAKLVARNPERHFIICTLEPRTVNIAGFDEATRLASIFPNTSALDIDINPLTFFSWLHSRKSNLAIIAPQFHALVAAYINKIPFLPMTYDNKVSELLAALGFTNLISYYEVTFEEMQKFVSA